MTKYTPLRTSQQLSNTRNRIPKIYFVPICFAFPIIIIYVNSIRDHKTDKDEKAAFDGIFSDPEYKSNILNDPKTILLWTPKHVPPLKYLGLGQKSFIKNECKFTNCFVAEYKRGYKGNVTAFDAIAFNGRNMRYNVPFDFPPERSPHQKYIFFNLESSANQPVCYPWYDGFFNWTSTYRLDSDIIYSYIHIRDLNGVSVGPKANMEWIQNMSEIDEELKDKLLSKKRAAAWFVSHCYTRSRRETYVQSLQKALEPYWLTVDVFGKCGTFVCDRKHDTECNSIVADEYYFYLAFESAFTEDYVTEKLLIALNNDAVPIVYGGADYSRFLPPGSYLDAQDYDPDTLASIMADAMLTPSKYHDFFRWRQHYKYSEAERVEDVCNVCAALNDRDKMAPSVREDFRSWWNPDWKERCKDENWYLQ